MKHMHALHRIDGKIDVFKLQFLFFHSPTMDVIVHVYGIVNAIVRNVA